MAKVWKADVGDVGDVEGRWRKKKKAGARRGLYTPGPRHDRPFHGC